jgi:hypothetical protein
MSYTTDKQLQSFLRRKIEALYEKAQRAKNPPTFETVIADLKSGKKLFDYELTKKNMYNRDNVHLNFSKSGSDIHIYIDTERQIGDTPMIYINIYNTPISMSRDIDKYPNFVYLLFEDAAQIEKEFLELKAECEKQEKIDDISAQSIETWLSSVLKGSGYTYYIKEDYNKITLSIRMKHGSQLDIPIYFRRFRKQMPDLLKTIKEYEEITANGKVKVLISNLKINKQWKSFN